MLRSPPPGSSWCPTCERTTPQHWTRSGSLAEITARRASWAWPASTYLLPITPPLQHHQGEPLAVSTASREPSSLAAPVRTRARTALRPLAPGDAHISGGFLRTRQDRHRGDALAA